MQRGDVVAQGFNPAWVGGTAEHSEWGGGGGGWWWRAYLLGAQEDLGPAHLHPVEADVGLLLVDVLHQRLPTGPAAATRSAGGVAAESKSIAPDMGRVANLAGADVKGVGGLSVAGLQGGFLTPPRGIGILLLPMAPPQQYPIPGRRRRRQYQPPRWSSSAK